MCPPYSFKEIIHDLQVKVRNNPSYLARSWFTVHAFGRTDFFELPDSVYLGSFVSIDIYYIYTRKPKLQKTKSAVIRFNRKNRLSWISRSTISRIFFFQISLVHSYTQYKYITHIKIFSNA